MIGQDSHLDIIDISTSTFDALKCFINAHEYQYQVRRKGYLYTHIY